MNQRNPEHHPGPWRVMKVDSEFAGLLLAGAFLVMGAVGLDIGKFFVMGAVGSVSSWPSSCACRTETVSATALRLSSCPELL